jgi:UDP-glucose 4-epimerase
VTRAEAAGSARVLVTGGSGFIGRAVVAAFRSRGTPVTVADLQPFVTTDPGVTSVVGDLADPAVREAALPPGTAGVVHLAAVTSVLRSVADPAHTYAENVAITQHLLELARRRGVQRFLLASTNAVTGDVGSATITEDAALRPLTPYGATKAACEMLLSGYAHAYQMATCSLRLTNVYGPGMAEKDSFVPRLMRAALAGGGVQVYGDGTQRRDLVHVSDVANAVLLAWERAYTGTAIIGSGRSVSVLELVDAARAATGRPLPVEHVPAKRGEMPAVVVDVSRAGRAFGYRPTVPLAEGLATVWRDFRDNPAPEPAGAAAPAGGGR